jgi:hypothetical protein
MIRQIRGDARPSKSRPARGDIGENGKSRINIFDHPLFSDLTASESIRVIAEAFHYSSIAEDKICREPGCEIVVHYGTFCEPHQRARHAEYERIAYARRGGKRKKKSTLQATALGLADAEVDCSEDVAIVTQPAPANLVSLPPIAQPKKVGVVVQLPLGVHVDAAAPKTDAT